MYVNANYSSSMCHTRVGNYPNFFEPAGSGIPEKFGRVISGITGIYKITKTAPNMQNPYFVLPPWKKIPAAVGKARNSPGKSRKNSEKFRKIPKNSKKFRKIPKNSKKIRKFPKIIFFLIKY